MRNLLRTLTGAAILGFGALAFSPTSAEANGYWRHPHQHHGWHRPYWAPRHAYMPRYHYAPRHYHYGPPRVVYGPRPYAGYYRRW